MVNDVVNVRVNLRTQNDVLFIMVDKWLGLAMNIWNNTPQPDRGSKSPFEISREYDIQSGG